MGESANLALYEIVRGRSLVPPRPLGDALEAAKRTGQPLERVLLQRELVSIRALEAALQRRANQARACGTCGEFTYLLTGQSEIDGVCERCGGELTRERRSTASNLRPPAAGGGNGNPAVATRSGHARRQPPPLPKRGEAPAQAKRAPSGTQARPPARPAPGPAPAAGRVQTRLDPEALTAAVGKALEGATARLRHDLKDELERDLPDKVTAEITEKITAQVLARLEETLENEASPITRRLQRGTLELVESRLADTPAAPPEPVASAEAVRALTGRLESMADRLAELERQPEPETTPGASSESGSVLGVEEGFRSLTERLEGLSERLAQLEQRPEPVRSASAKLRQSADTDVDDLEDVDLDDSEFDLDDSDEGEALGEGQLAELLERLERVEQVLGSNIDHMAASGEALEDETEFRLQAFDKRLGLVEETLSGKSGAYTAFSQEFVDQVVNVALEQVSEKLDEREVERIAAQAVDAAAEKVEQRLAERGVIEDVVGQFVSDEAVIDEPAAPSGKRAELDPEALEEAASSAVARRLDELEVSSLREEAIEQALRAVERKVEDENLADRVNQFVSMALRESLKKLDTKEISEKVALQATGPLMSAIDSRVRELDADGLDRRLVELDERLTGIEGKLAGGE